MSTALVSLTLSNPLGINTKHLLFTQQRNSRDKYCRAFNQVINEWISDTCYMWRSNWLQPANLKRGLTPNPVARNAIAG